MHFTTIPALCADITARHGAKTAIEEGGLCLSYGEVDAIRRQLAKALIASGLQHGERVMIWAPNCWQWVVSALAITSVGGVLIPANTRYRPQEVHDLVSRGGAVMLFSVGHFLERYYPDDLLPQTRALLRDVVVLDDAHAPDVTWRGFLARGDTVPDAVLNARMARVQPDDLCDMLFTSGTTGFPKGVMYEHQKALRATDAWGSRVAVSENDHVLVIPPFFHSFGYRAGALISLMRGATLYPHLTYDAGDILHRIAKDRISVVPGPPSIFIGFLQHPDRASFDLSSLRVGVTGSTTVAPSLIRRMREELGFQAVISGYGLTECGGYGTLCAVGDSDEVVAHTAGRAFDDTEVRIMAPDGTLLGPDESGEVVIRGYLTMRGYFNDDEATRQTIDADGWLHTGDIGALDVEGNLRILDRLKDVYICGGFNCYPAEIERMLSAHPAIAQVAVIGVEDERLGEVGKAYVVLRAGMALNADELIHYARAQMANYKVPRHVEFRGSLPLSAQGKVLKTALRAE